ncbi:MAG: TetR/AcrR family transcriptional regulator [Lachnospiraceae bacterium]|nr:TetR/AcrR family transcriptional regulator [Lachnospiraceae bacterium]
MKTLYLQNNAFQTAKTYLAQALINLMEKTSIGDISITDITKKAGVSRMSYYRYFGKKEEILESYLDTIIEDYIREVDSGKAAGQFSDYDHILKSFQFFKQYKDFALCLDRANMSNLLLNRLNGYFSSYVAKPTSDFKEKTQLYFYAGALFNTFMQWLENDTKEDEETLAVQVYQMTKKMFPSA